MIKKICFIIIMLYSIFMLNDCCYADSEVYLQADIANIEKNQKFNVSILAKETNIVALTTRLFFDSDKLEFVKGPENSNCINNTVIYTWFDENGGKNSITDRRNCKF